VSIRREQRGDGDGRTRESSIGAQAGTATGDSLLSTRRRALGITAAATAGLLVDRALAPESALAAEAESFPNLSAQAVATANISSLSGIPSKSLTDEVELEAGQIVLLVGQSTGSQNGVWAVAAGAWTRPTGFTHGSEQRGVISPILAGATHAGSVWLLKNKAKVVVDTTAQEWESSTVTGVLATKPRTALGLEALQSDAGGHFNTAVGYQAMANAKQDETTFTATITKGSKTLTAVSVAKLSELNFGGFLTCAAHPNALPEECVLAPLPTEAEFEKNKELKIEQAALESVTGASILQRWGAGYSTALGYRALQAITTGSGNTAVGEIAGVHLTTGGENTIVGCEAMDHAETANICVAIGFLALNANTASGNVAVGASAAANNTTGEYNVAVGRSALEKNTTGAQNVAVGNLALEKNNGSANVAIGDSAMRPATGANANTAVGYAAMAGATTAEENVAIGTFAGGNITSGESNTLVGADAGSELKTGSKNVMIGYNAGHKETGSNKLYIANSETNTPLILGEFPNESLQFNATKMGFFKATPVTQPAKPAENAKAIIEVLEKLGLVA
jgi:hypothetical protein